MKKILLACLATAMYFTSYAQCSLREVSLTDRANAADLIVEGKVTATQSWWNVPHNMIYTSNTIELYKVFKGSVTTTSIEIITTGGTVGLDKITADPSLHLNVGDIGLFTCETVKHVKGMPVSRGGLPKYEAYASVQGFVKYDLDTQTASDPFHKYNNVVNDLYPVVLSPAMHHYQTIGTFNLNGSGNQRIQQNVSIASIGGFSPTTLRAGTGDVLTITGSGFGATQGSGTVGFKNADDGGSTYIHPLASQYVSWSNTQIQVEVPSGAGTGTIQVTQGATSTSAGTLTISYAHLNVEFDPGPGTVAYQTDHVDDNGSGGYTWRTNTNFLANTAANDAFLRAFDTWRCNTGVNWTIGANTSIDDAVSDGTNVICFDDQNPLPGGVLGVCYSYWSGCASGPNIIWYVNELDIIFDEGSNISPLNWQYGPATPSINEYDFESVAVHELGHGHQLGHVISPGAIMHYALSNGSFDRTLSANDLAGGNFVQAKSLVANICGPGAMTNHTCGTAPVASFSSDVQTVCEGGTVNFTDQSSNTPTSWNWTFNGGTPSSSTSQNPSVTYNTPGVYDVTLSVSNGAGSDQVTAVTYIIVNSLPTIGASSDAVNDAVCAGQSVTLSGNGGVSYSWTGGVTDGVPFTPPSTGSYTVTGTDGNGCESTASITVTVNNLPTIGATSDDPDNTICAGSQVTLFGNGGQSYNWSSGVIDAVGFVPGSTATYTVTGTDANGCDNTATIQIIVDNGPSSLGFTSSPANGIICTGGTATLSGTGAVSYSWTGGISDGVPFQPGATDTYTLTGTDANGCDATTTATITVDNGPTLNITSNPANGIICNGNQATLTATGAVSYSWTGGVTNGVPFSPTVTDTYTVTGTDANGCDATDFATITVNNCSMASVPCGNTYNKKTLTVSASNVPGATAYRFSFYDNVSGVLVGQVTQATRTLTLSSVPNICYGSTYKWTVAVNTGSGFGAESSNSCTITLGVPTTTVPCGVTYQLSSYSTVVPPGGTGNYRFTFYNATTGVQVAQRTQMSNYIYFNTVSGLFPGNTYKWTVACEYALSGGGSTFGPESSNNCTVTFPAPQTVVPCNRTYSLSNGYTTATPVTGAITYRFKFYSGATLVGSRVNVSNYIYFNTVPGLVNNTTYNWTVEVQYNNGSNNVFGPPSAQCPVSFGSSSIAANYDTDAVDGGTISKDEPNNTVLGVNDPNTDLNLSVYPNPVHDRLTLNTSEYISAIYVYSVTGELLRTFASEHDIPMSDLTPGTYFVLVKTESGMKRAVVIKE